MSNNPQPTNQPTPTTMKTTYTYELFADDGQCRVDRGDDWVLFNDPSESPEAVACSEGEWTEDELDAAQAIAEGAFERGS